MSSKLHSFAEIIESSLPRYKAQCWDSNKVPQYGSLVVVEQQDLIIYGIVYQVYVASDDPMRQIHSYQRTEEELQKEQPQIFAFLKTFFSVLILGYKEGDRVYQRCAPIPSKLHSFVRLISDDELALFLREHSYLHLIFAQAHQIDGLDELLLALLSFVKQRTFFNTMLADFIEQYCLLTSTDYRRLKFFIERIELL